jgi:hypothetical protein
MNGLRCKTGDLARILWSRHSELIDSFVTVCEFLGTYEQGQIGLARGRPFVAVFPGPLWAVEHRLGVLVFRDQSLQPIRDQPGEDEMLRIAGKPNDEILRKLKAVGEQFREAVKR